MTSRIHWKDTEVQRIVHDAALLHLDNPSMSWSQLVIHGMRSALPQARWRPEASLRTVAKAAFQELIELESSIIQEERNAEAERARVAQKVQDASGVTVEQVKAAESISHAPFTKDVEVFAAELNTAADGMVAMLMEIIRPRIRPALVAMMRTEVAEAANEVASEIKTATTHLADGKSVNVLNVGGNEVKIDRVKVGYIGGGQKGQDHVLLRNGLEDVYNFVFVDSLTMGETMKNCQVLIRSKHCSHQLWSMARRMSPQAKIMAEDITPSKANGILLEWYANNVVTHGMPIQQSVEQEQQPQA